jgi:hypothetical protein
MSPSASPTIDSLPAEAAEEVIAGDQAVAFGYVTPAEGVVLLPLTNTGWPAREGRLTPVSSSVGMWRKLMRIRQNPYVAVAYHTRTHGFSERPEYVLVQGRAALTSTEDRGWVERHLANWERFSGPRDVGPVWERWLSAYHWRVGVEIEVDRVVVWPDLTCDGEPQVIGSALLNDSPPPQEPPLKGTGPRVDHRRAARRAARLPNRLLAWVAADGFPVVVPVNIAGVAEHGIVLDLPGGVEVPPGGRRAGFLAHSFSRYTYGQRQRKHTGWLLADPAARRAVYAPHTQSGYWLPGFRFVYRAAAGFATRRGLRGARRSGFVRS